MSVRKTTRSKVPREAWIVDYVDQEGLRHIETFDLKKDAVDFEATVKVDVRAGTHTPASKSITVAQAADDRIAFVQGKNANAAPSTSIATTYSTSTPASVTRNCPVSPHRGSTVFAMNCSREPTSTNR